MVLVGDVVVTVASVAAALLSVKAALIMRSRSMPVTVAWLSTVFTLLAAGFVLWALGDVAWDIMLYVLGVEPYPSIADLFYVAGYIPAAAGLAYLWREVWVSRGEPRNQVVAFIVGALGIGALTYLMISGSIMAVGQEGETLTEAALDYAYPLLSALMASLAFGVYWFFGSSKIKKALLLIAGGMLFFFVGDMVFTYLAWNGIETGVWSLVSNGAYLLSYVLSGFGFWTLVKKGKGK